MGDKEELKPPESAAAAPTAPTDPAWETQPAYPQFPCNKLLMNAMVPIEPFMNPAVEVTETGVRYIIVTNSPNSSRMQIGLNFLRTMGCTVILDHESMGNFTMIIIDAPRKLFSDEEIAEIRAQKSALEAKGG